MLDFTTLPTEFGRCSPQCPAWKHGKARLAPKLLILSLRDHPTRRPLLLPAAIPRPLFEGDVLAWRRRNRTALIGGARGDGPVNRPGRSLDGA